MMEHWEFIRLTPVFRIFSVEKALEFYVDYLGFQLDWSHQFDGEGPVYMQVSLGELTLHLTEHHGDCCPGSKAYVSARGVEAYHNQLKSRNYPSLRPGLNRSLWGAPSLNLIDPFGNRILIEEPRGVETESAADRQPEAKLD